MGDACLELDRGSASAWSSRCNRAERALGHESSDERYGPRPLTDRFPSEHDQAHPMQGSEISRQSDRRPNLSGQPFRCSSCR
jgi:hypothetical protein